MSEYIHWINIDDFLHEWSIRPTNTKISDGIVPIILGLTQTKRKMFT